MYTITMLIQAKKIPSLQGPLVGTGRGDPIITSGQNRKERRPISYEVSERTRMFTSNGAPIQGTIGDIIGTVFPVAKPFIMAGDTIADLVRGKSGGMEGAIGDAISSIPGFGVPKQKEIDRGVLPRMPRTSLTADIN